MPLLDTKENDEETHRRASETSFSIGCGHTFVVFLKEGFPINVLNAIKVCQEVCHVICATANPLQLIVAESEQGGGILGVIDGFRPKAIEKEEDKKARKELFASSGTNSERSLPENDAGRSDCTERF